MAKNDEILLINNKKRKKKDNIASNESIGVNHSTKFEKIPTAIKEKDGERLLAKTKLRKIKKSKIYDESLGTCEFSSEFNEKPKDHKEKFKKGCKHKKKYLTNDKESKVEEVEKIVHKEKIDEIYSADTDCTVEMKTKNDERLLVKTKKKKIQDNVVSDGSITANKSSEFEMRHTTKNGKDAERYLVKAKKQKIKKCKIHDDSVGTCELPSEFDKGPKIHKGKLKKCCKQKNKHLTNDKECNLEVVQRVVDEEKVDEISSVDTDCLNGMKKWLLQYKQSRPGLEVLQQRIDEVVTAHEEQQDQERKEREARAAEDGWTVVIHQKGRKKTTDAETGTAVGSVASAAVIDKMSKKKNKEIAMDFYRFQKREAKLNEVIMLQSKFEQDKKRIQQLRAARKFRPC